MKVENIYQLFKFILLHSFQQKERGLKIHGSEEKRTGEYVPGISSDRKIFNYCNIRNAGIATVSEDST